MMRHLAWLGIAALVTFAPSVARAGDPLKPYVVLILDTSGSMDASTGSGPPSCGGSDTRLNHAKCAINNIVNSYGDMVFGFGRFRETTSGSLGASGQCDANGDLNGNPNADFPSPSGGDVCGTQGVYCGNCLIDNNDDDAQTRTCNDDGDCAGGTCAGGVCQLGGCTIADRELEVLTPLVDGNNALAAAWTDNACGVCSVPTAGTSPTSANEIWGVSPFTFTPLAAVLNGAKLYWRGQEKASDGTTVIWPSTAAGFAPIAADPTKTAFLPTGCDPSPTCTGAGCCASQCRPYVTILLTDGAETCTNFSNTTAAAGALLRTDVGGRRYRIETKPIGFGITPGNQQIEDLAHAGGAVNLPGNEGFYAQNEAELQLAISSILDGAIKTEQCNDLDDDCDVAIDEDFPDKGNSCDNGKLGACKRTGNLVCKADGTGLQCDAPDASGSDEVCNTEDDDCDGKVDEGLTNCACTPQAEQCNGNDDDCDGAIDEGIGPIACNNGACQGQRVCTNGSFGACSADTPTDEVCNGLDDNCDGVADGLTEACSDLSNGFPPDDPRNNPGDPSHNPIPENVCHPGQHTCAATSGPPNSFGPCLDEVQPGTEVCNGLDDDCDNQIDEGTGGADCSSTCGIGTTVCTNGQLECTTTPAASDDTCDGNDDDCDGSIDEDFVCSDPPNCACSAAGQCNAHESCVAGQVVCQGTSVQQESCDCDDNDCDGEVDEGSLCGGGATCTACQCAFPCSNSEFPCPLGKVCNNGFCIADPCFGVACPPVNGNKQVCQINANGTQGACVDACSVINCGALLCIPETGECKPDDCTTFPDRCADGESCVVNPTTGLGECVSNPCDGVTCPADQYCLGGECHGSCAEVECPDGERCRLGVCEPDPCGRPCPFGQACNDATGECIDDTCDIQTCPQGQWCNPNNSGGKCEPDPCVVDGVECPNPTDVCRGGTCFDPNDFLPDAGTPVIVTTGGGGGCSTGGDAGGGLVLGLALIGLVARRKERRS